METITKLLRISLITCISLFVIFVIYANWEEPPLSERLNLKPIELTVFTLNRDLTIQDSLSIAKKLSVNQGVTAATVNRLGKTVSITFHPDETSEAILRTLVESEDFKPSKIDFASFKGPQCPVPMEYIDFVLNAKRALCFR
jgi:hypothetical protein